jgi:fumarate hydratase class II
MRIEKDALGEISLPSDAPRGIYTERVRHLYPRANIFSISELFMRTYIESKLIYATVNEKVGKISSTTSNAIHMA